MAQTTRTVTGRGTLALLPWGDLFEDYLDPIGLTLDDFVERQSGGWLFGYVEALRSAGIRTLVLCVTARVAAPERRTHGPTGATVCLVPAPALYRRLRRRMVDPYGWTVDGMFGEVRGPSRFVYSRLQPRVPYLANPLAALRREILRDRCGAILCQEYEWARFDRLVALGRRLGIPVFATFQGGRWQPSALETRSRPQSVRQAAGLIVASEQERRRVRETYGVPDERIARIFNPLDLSVWRPAERAAARRELDLPPGARIAAWHGRVERHRKGLDLLLEAWDRVWPGPPGAERSLLLLGDGADATWLEREVARRPGSGIRWLREYVLDPDAIRRRLAAADVYVFPSRHEGFPVAPLEAMACGLPLVAAEAPGIPEILEHGERSGGLAVPVGDAAALAAALGALLDDPGRSEALGGQALRRVQGEFSIEAVGERLSAFLTRRGAFPERPEPRRRTPPLSPGRAPGRAPGPPEPRGR